MSVVKVTRKGQITIPKEIREKMSISTGDYLVLEARGNIIIVRKLEPPTPGEPVGEEEYQELIKELEELRKAWR